MRLWQAASPPPAESDTHLLIPRLHSQLRILPNITTSLSSSVHFLTQLTEEVEDEWLVLAKYQHQRLSDKQQTLAFSRRLCYTYTTMHSIQNARQRGQH
jgi:hypothetical protein